MQLIHLNHVPATETPIWRSDCLYLSSVFFFLGRSPHPTTHHPKKQTTTQPKKNPQPPPPHRSSNIDPGAEFLCPFFFFTQSPAVRTYFEKRGAGYCRDLFLLTPVIPTFPPFGPLYSAASLLFHAYHGMHQGWEDVAVRTPFHYSPSIA